MKIKDYPKTVLQWYKNAYDNEIQGLCLLIADEIQKVIGGEVVAGYLTWYGGSCQRPHWWVEKDGKTIDPMGDELLSYEESPGRKEIHRNIDIFINNLKSLEKYRL